MGLATSVKKYAKRNAQRCRKLRADWGGAPGASRGIFRRDTLSLFSAGAIRARRFGEEAGGDGVVGREAGGCHEGGGLGISESGIFESWEIESDGLQR